MLPFKYLAVAAGCGLVASGALFSAVQPAAAAGACVSKAAQGTGSDEKSAKFQVDEALLQAVDWGAWASWMANGTTPGYDFGKRTYKCKTGTGLGVTCVGQAKICKKA
jgi:hypothetical protein